MRVLLAPDCFGGTLSAPDAAQALAEGWLRAAPADDLDLCPLSDGGPGLLEVLRPALPGSRDLQVVVEGPHADPVPAVVLLHEGTAWVESAQACGLHLTARRDPGSATTYGVGQLVLAALDAGARRVVVGLGGSATHDGGAGALAALDVSRHGPDGRLPPGGAALLDLVRLEGRPDPRLADVDLVAATDVDVALAGAAQFLPQKGASDVGLLVLALTRWADHLEPHLGVAVRDLP
ncbi:MAG: glycerate kinase, partial [Frankiales bacterium]|nr:glycerate kinase [Frankiales bacterium]